MTAALASALGLPSLASVSVAAPPPVPTYDTNAQHKNGFGNIPETQRRTFQRDTDDGRGLSGYRGGEVGQGHADYGQGPGRSEYERGLESQRAPVAGREPPHQRVFVQSDEELASWRRPYMHLRGFREYGIQYGLPPALAAQPNLAFLSDGLLVASYVESSGHTIYVYMVGQDGAHREFLVADTGAILGSRIVP